MNERIDFQTIEQDGKPAFAVVPFEQFRDLMAAADRAEPTVPHEVVNLMFDGDGMSAAAAWRKHLGLSQAEVGKRMGVSQSAYAQMERAGSKPRKATRERLAEALGILPAQLDL